MCAAARSGCASRWARCAPRSSASSWRQGLRVSLLGCLAGLALAAACTRLLAGMLYGVSASDSLTLAGVVAIVLAVSIAASLLPAIRASRVEPMQVLRDE